MLNSADNTDEECGLVQASPPLADGTDLDRKSTLRVTPRPTTADQEGAVRAVRRSWGSELRRGRGNSVEESTKGKARRMWKFLSTGMKQNVDKIRSFDVKSAVLTHGLQHLRNFPCNDPVRHMTYGKGAAGFISLHREGKVVMYHPDGRLRDLPPASVSVPYMGLTSTQLPGRLVGWGPGASLTLLDSELRPLANALDPLDVRVCQVTEQSLELVTAGAGNVCVWCLTHMVCRVRVTEGLGRHSVFTQLALAPPGPERHHRAFVVYGRAVVVVDLTAGRVLEHKRNLHLRDITALVYSFHLDFVVTASKDVSIRVWGPDWGLCMAFVGHTGVVTSLACCPESGLLLSASLDGTLRCWSLEGGDQVQCFPIEGGEPPLALGGPMKGGTFFTFSQQGVDFWTISSLYNLHCRLGGDLGGPVRQIVVPSCPLPYPTRVLCVSGDSNVTLVAAETGAVLTSFGAGQRVRCADYCLHKEILLVLTEGGTLIRASTLTNPATCVDEWKARGQGPWQREEQTDGEGDQWIAKPGPASCMVLYSNIADGQRALDEWKSLQKQRCQRPTNKKSLHDAKNRFLVMLGHNGGCVSVLMLDTGKVQYMTPAHNGQKITSLQADPENSYLLTVGEDKAVLVWRVFPYAQECLSLHLNLFCGHPPLYLTLLGPLLAIAFQDPDSATYSLVHFSLLNQSRTDHPPSEDHLDCITGLCVCHQLRVFASSSQDGTVRIWDEDNRLLRTLQLSAEPECLAYSGQRGDLLLGIRGDLYRIRCAHLLPHDFQLRLLSTEMSDPIPDLPISSTSTRTSKTKTVVSPIPEKQPNGKQDMTKDPEYEALLARNRDLASLQEGTTERRKRKPPTTLKTRKEAFDRYMRIIYSQPLDIKIGDEDMFDLHAALFPPKLPDRRPFTPPTLRNGFFPNPNLAKPLPPITEPGQDEELEPAPAQSNPVGFIPNSVLVGQLWPGVVVENTIPKQTFKLRDEHDYEEEGDTEEVQFLVYESDEDIGSPIQLVKSPQKEKSPPPPTPEKPAYVMRPPKAVPPTKIPKLPTPPPPRTPTPPCTYTPEIPEFLKQFVEEDWFKDIYQDQRCIGQSLCPEEFSMQILDHMQSCGAQLKMRILSALITLRRQGELGNTDKLSKGLMGSLRNNTSSNMSDEEQRVVSEILNVLLVCLGPESHEIIVELLTLLAHKELGLQKTVMCLLQVMGVEDADPWLAMEMDPWDSMVQDLPVSWKSLGEMAAEWLHSWTSKYKGQNSSLFLKNAGKNLFTPVDVLNYFCSVKRDMFLKAQTVPPEGRKDTVLRLPESSSSKPIQRLGETYSMSRIRKPPGVILPPLPNRPVLMGFTPFLTLPLPRVSLSPFPFPVDQHCLKASPRRYFILERSYVHYYR
ncbi:WD repeat-containing protein 97 [Salvelinus sp. IW2-2015]|uniref:WD repeat-containing protein 97 n=1 Tax=Salvelinus sp. IW2-2015 TaxID=2691554 RepID=UPI000CDF7D2A|nr:WD repeat-containing protein 97 [Salvelinus alpinus]